MELAGTTVSMRLLTLKIVVYSLTRRTGRLPFAKYGLERWGARTCRAKRRSRRLALSRKTRLKDASCLSGMNRATKATPTAEPIFGELSATVVRNNNSRFNPR
jgi:hypothetical protein